MPTGSTTGTTLPQIPAVMPGDGAHPTPVPVVIQGGGVGGSATIADGADVCEGALADAAVVTDAAGSVSAKLRGLVVVLLRAFALGTPLRVDPTGGTAQPVTVASLPALPANQSVNVAQINGAAPLMGAGNTGTGSARVTIATDQAVLPTTSQAGTSGGATPYHYIAAASANQDSQNVKNGVGTLYGISAFCTQAAIRYLKLYDKATAPTSADTPIYTMLIPGNAAGAGAVDVIGLPGIAFTTGLGLRITTGLADNDATAASANDCVVNLRYK